jgi:glyceraldehyde-3-phosphate dehydrogenase (NAD(P))
VAILPPVAEFLPLNSRQCNPIAIRQNLLFVADHSVSIRVSKSGAETMAQKKIVHIVGTGTIGEPLVGILSTFKEQFGVDEVTFHKRTPLLTDRSKVIASCSKGAKLAVDKERWQKFVDMGMHPSLEAEEAIERAAVIIDCTPVGNENKEKLYARYANNGRGFIAQGSEDGFGKKYARGINDKALERGKDQFIQVVSCNTHNLAVLIDTIALGPEKEDNLDESRFVCMRRANDLSQEGDFIPAPEAGKHDDPQFGTHQGRDAHYLFKTLGLDLNIYSSALKLNTQYMHTIHFNLKLRRGIDKDELMRRLQANSRVALTNKKSSASVFSFGRDHGMFGRILNQTVIVSQSLAMRGDREIIGTCFTPQDGNSLLSSIAAAMWFMYPDSYEEKLAPVRPYFFNEI